MRSGIWRGAATACALLGAWTASAPAGGFHTIPRLTPALDYRTGGQYYAPPIPYGHYVGKDIPGHVLGAVHGPVGLVRGKLIGGLFHGRRRDCGGAGCSDCGGAEWGDESGIVDSSPGYAPTYGGPDPDDPGSDPRRTVPGDPEPPDGPDRTDVGTGHRRDPPRAADRMIHDPALRGTGWGHAEASPQGIGMSHGGPYGAACGDRRCGPGGCGSAGPATHGGGSAAAATAAVIAAVRARAAADTAGPAIRAAGSAAAGGDSILAALGARGCPTRRWAPRTGSSARSSIPAISSTSSAPAAPCR